MCLEDKTESLDSILDLGNGNRRVVYKMMLGFWL